MPSSSVSARKLTEDLDSVRVERLKRRVLETCSGPCAQRPRRTAPSPWRAAPRSPSYPGGHRRRTTALLGAVGTLNDDHDIGSKLVQRPREMVPALADGRPSVVGRVSSSSGLKAGARRWRRTGRSFHSMFHNKKLSFGHLYPPCGRALTSSPRLTGPWYLRTSKPATCKQAAMILDEFTMKACPIHTAASLCTPPRFSVDILCSVQPWQVIFGYYSLLLCRILQVNFGESPSRHSGE